MPIINYDERLNVYENMRRYYEKFEKDNGKSISNSDIDNIPDNEAIFKKYDYDTSVGCEHYICGCEL